MGTSRCLTLLLLQAHPPVCAAQGRGRSVWAGVGAKLLVFNVQAPQLQECVVCSRQERHCRENRSAHSAREQGGICEWSTSGCLYELPGAAAPHAQCGLSEGALPLPYMLLHQTGPAALHGGVSAGHSARRACPAGALEGHRVWYSALLVCRGRRPSLSNQSNAP